MDIDYIEYSHSSNGRKYNLSSVEKNSAHENSDKLPWVPGATRLLNPAGQRPAKRA